MSEVKFREYRIDNLRAIAIVLIVLGHSIIIYSTTWRLYETNISAPFLDLVKKIINLIQLPLFFSLSGYLFYNTLKRKKVKEIINDKIKRLLFPFLIFACLWLLPIRLLVNYPGYQNISLKTIIVNRIILGFDNGHLWYLPTLFLVFIIYAFLFALEKKIGIRHTTRYCVNFIIGVFFYGLQLLFSFPTYIGFICEYFLWFSLGLILHNMDFLYKNSNFRKKKIILVILCFILTCVSVCKPNLLYTNMASFLWILCLFSARLDFENKILSILSANSFGIYLLHSPLVYITYTVNH